jgi:hypothetical protein
MEHDDIMSKINSAKEQFYCDHQKNTFFKKQQKFDCATSVMSGLNENDVFSNVFAVKDDIIFFNYSLFKTVAHPEYYEKMADYLFVMSLYLIEKYETYQIFVNCNGITISAIERYKEFIIVVSKRGLDNNKGLLAKLRFVHISNPPSFLDHGLKILIPLIDNDLWNKISIVQDAKK